MTLAQRNRENCEIERKNNDSAALTRAYERARGSTAGVGALDVGPPMLSFYKYPDEDTELLAASPSLVTSSGPIPQYIALQIAKANLKATQEVILEREKREKEKSELEKARADVSGLGTRVMLNPVAFSAVLVQDVQVPSLFVETINQRLWPPLHWWADSILLSAERDPQTIPTVMHTPLQSSPLVKPIKVQVIDFAKMTARYGGISDTNTLSPSLWRQCARNLLRAVTTISSKEPTAITPATELAKHLQFFGANKWFDSEFAVWYSVELELRALVFFNTLFDQVEWSSQLSIHMCTHAAVAAQAPIPSHGQSSSLKRGADGDGNPSNSKRHNGGGGSPRGGTRDPSCLICTGPHSARDHPRSQTSFRDGSKHFTQMVGDELRTSAPFRGGDTTRICVVYNIGRSCDGQHRAGGQPTTRLHACSLCVSAAASSWPIGYQLSAAASSWPIGYQLSAAASSWPIGYQRALLHHPGPSASSFCRRIFLAYRLPARAETGDDADQEKFEDDLAIIRYLLANGTYRFDRQSIEELIAPLKVPWHPTKTGVKFVEVAVWIGFTWDFRHRRVSVPEDKQLKYLARVVAMILRMDKGGKGAPLACGIAPSLVYVPSLENRADAPSRGLVGDLSLSDRIVRSFDLPTEIEEVFSYRKFGRRRGLRLQIRITRRVNTTHNHDNPFPPARRDLPKQSQPTIPVPDPVLPGPHAAADTTAYFARVKSG
ncbi:hypothetical protein FB45DRAFT_883021 [Roridomyces roridus]|uniref:Uncharacterized protein n=1 Tax=Roridomyces roridus TaxID=1738132 RepID=A0AAD7AX16_9AGAR|nr:hypothetical protein FB45DRAFT_883021 [Roridomyces roridus]